MIVMPFYREDLGSLFVRFVGVVQSLKEIAIYISDACEISDDNKIR